MKWKFGLVFGLALAWFSVAAMGQPVPAPGGAQMTPPPNPDDKPVRAADDIENRPIPNLDVAGPLSTVLAQVKSAMSDLNVVVSLDPDVSQEPVLPRISVKNITVGQLFDLVKAACPGTDVQRIEGHGPPLYLIRVSRVLPTPGYPTPSPIFVYHLSKIINSLAANKTGKDANAQALNDVMSLVQDALTGIKTEGAPGKLEVHPQTEMLIFKGSPEQIAVVEQVLKTLEPTANDEMMLKANDDSQRAHDELIDQVNRLKAQSAEREAEYTAAQRDLLQMKLQLEAAQQQLVDMRAAQAAQQHASTRPRE